ncbi:MAG: RtcB family protein [Phycisphaerales bacterium]|nr:RtcB family protein [Phycisphaerales bacterium]
MKPRELANLGVPKHAMKTAIETVVALLGDGHSKTNVRLMIAGAVAAPDDHLEREPLATLARALQPAARPDGAFIERREPAPWRQWGEGLDENSIEQMRNACRLPVAVRAALMPDAHLGYGLPIGGVLATSNAVIPYAVGVDIACRMKLTVLDLPESALRGQSERLADALETQTRFGLGAAFRDRNDHDVLDADWTVSPVTTRFKDKAWTQLGTSGSGNHFVEFGRFTVDDPAHARTLGLEPGTYLALLSHSGSRGTGASVADHYSRLAMDLHPELPKPLRHLAWLDLDTEPGQEYWRAMNLMGEYAAANHAIIHRRIAKHLGARIIADVENHHNFAWAERHDDQDVIVHRKGATPAGEGVLGVIPGSMASPAFVVRGRGSVSALDSASHGAGRVMSRTEAKRSFTWSDVKKHLAARGVTLLSAGLDEVPMVYKDIHTVMAAQTDLVEILATFDPCIVKMAPPGERAED